MGCRGVLFAIDQDEVRGFGQATSDREVRALVATIEERWDERFLAQTDKAWDAIHRCLTDGTLEWGNGSFRLNRCILLDPADYGPNWSEEDFDYTWSWFQEVRDLWSRAATAGRAVIFTVSQ